jgi:hypothetical protein
MTAEQGERPTREWIGSPSREDIELFLWFVHRHVGSRPPGKTKHQTAQIAGDFIAWGRGGGRSVMRATDRTWRIYASVSLLEILGEANWEACREVAEQDQDRLGTTKRGRPRKQPTPSACYEKVETIRGQYNWAKRHHRWPEKLPERDLELEFWWGAFLHFKAWALAQSQAALRESSGRGISIEQWCKETEAAYVIAGRIVSDVVRELSKMRSVPRF